MVAKVDELTRHPDPEQLGKPLQDELQGLRRLSHGRYRILYRVIRRSSPSVLVVQVIFVGIRKAGDKRDIYEIAGRLRRRGLI